MKNTLQKSLIYQRLYGYLQSNKRQIISIMNVLEEIGERVKSIRRDRKLKQSELASKAGIGITTVYRLENGENVSTEAFVKALAVLGLDDRLLMMLSSISNKREIKPKSVHKNSTQGQVESVKN